MKTEKRRKENEMEKFVKRRIITISTTIQNTMM